MKLHSLPCLALLLLHCNISAMKVPQPDTTFDLPALIPALANVTMPRYRCDTYINKWNTPGQKISKETLSERLCSKYPLLIEHTELIENLTREALSINSVLFYVDLAIHDSIVNLQKRGCSPQVALLTQYDFEHSRSDILNRIFWDHKEVINLLRKSGYYKPMVK